MDVSYTGWTLLWLTWQPRLYKRPLTRAAPDASNVSSRVHLNTTPSEQLTPPKRGSALQQKMARAAGTRSQRQASQPQPSQTQNGRSQRNRGRAVEEEYDEEVEEGNEEEQEDEDEDERGGGSVRFIDPRCVVLEELYMRVLTLFRSRRTWTGKPMTSSGLLYLTSRSELHCGETKFQREVCVAFTHAPFIFVACLDVVAHS